MEFVWPAYMAVWQDGTDIYISPKDRYYSVKFCCCYSKNINAYSGQTYQFADTFACIWVDAYTGLFPRASGHFRQITKRRGYEDLYSNLNLCFGDIPCVATKNSRAREIEDIVLQLLPQPIAEEIIPHLMLSVRAILGHAVY